MSERRDRQDQGDVQTKPKQETQKPRMYKVLLYNDDYTTMEFVIWILQSVFRRSPAESTRIMLLVHRNGVGIAGVYSREVAETRVHKTVQLARANGHPLECTMEPE